MGYVAKHASHAESNVAARSTASRATTVTDTTPGYLVNTRPAIREPVAAATTSTEDLARGHVAKHAKPDAAAVTATSSSQSVTTATSVDCGRFAAPGEHARLLRLWARPPRSLPLQLQPMFSLDMQQLRLSDRINQRIRRNGLAPAPLHALQARAGASSSSGSSQQSAPNRSGRLASSEVCQIRRLACYCRGYKCRRCLCRQRRDSSSRLDRLRRCRDRHRVRAGRRTARRT